MDILFSDTDDINFREAAGILLSSRGNEKRSENSATYLERCRDAWAEAPVDEFYNKRILFDEKITGEGEDLYCAILAIIETEFDEAGSAWRTPENYDALKKPRTKRVREVIFVSPNGSLAPPSDTPQKETVMLGFFDVLGFEQRFATEGLDSIYSLYSDLIHRTLIPSAGQNKLSSAVGTFAGELREGYLKLPIQYSYFSDTILMWAPFHNAYVGTFLDRCSGLFCNALGSGVPLRGAISFGEAVLHTPTNIFLGAPLIEGARTEAAQDWAGVALSTSVREIGFPPDRVQRYDPPVKDGREYLLSGLSLDWPRYWRDFASGSAIDTLRELKSEQFPKYYDNAEKFVDFSDANKDWMMKELEAQIGAVTRAEPEP